MTSHYDPLKKCRVGTMDEKQFYSEASQKNAAYFKSLIQAWQKHGGSFKWGAGGVGLRSEIGGKEVGVCFVAPAFAGKKDRIELSLTILAKQIGKSRCAALKTALSKAAGDSMKGTSMVCILEPGSLAPAGQRSLTAALGELH